MERQERQQERREQRERRVQEQEQRLTAAAEIHPVKYCPLCGEDNRCGYSAGQPIEACWCFSAGGFPKELLELVPPAKRRTACICERCLRRFREDAAGFAADCRARLAAGAG